MANYYGESVQGLRLEKMSSGNNSQNKSDNDKTGSSIFSCNFIVKSPSDSPDSNAVRKPEQDINGNMSPMDD